MNKKCISVTIFLTDCCNLACLYCYEKNSRRGCHLDESLLPQVVKFVVSLAEKHGAEMVLLRFHGGEPLLNSLGIRHLISCFDRETIKCTYSMTTNGTIWDDDVRNILERVDDLSVSIDGDKKTHDMNRRFRDGRGSFDYVHRNMKNILEIQPKATARMTVTPKTVFFLQDNINFLIENGFKEIIAELDLTNRGWTQELVDVYVEQMKSAAHAHWKSIEKGQLCFPILSYAREKKQNGICSGGSTSFCIHTDGRVYPCVDLAGIDEWCIGDISTGIVQNKVASIQKLNCSVMEECVGCARYDYCRSTRCRLVNWHRTGNPNKRTVFLCRNEHIAVDLGRYFEDIKGMFCTTKG